MSNNSLMMTKHFSPLAVMLLTAVAFPVLALEYPIGKPHDVHGMEIAAVYLQPTVMQPPGPLPAKDADIHLEADIHALEDNPNGFPPGAWVPDLDIHYELTRQGSDKPIYGDLDAMVASDGPHYGANVKLQGPGLYHLTFTIKPPRTSNGRPFMRHIDKETGVADWYQPFSVDYDFVFAGVGKKGGY